MFLTVLWLGVLFPSSLGNIATRPRTRLSDVFKLKCDSLPYRTVYLDQSCYFIINTAIDSSETVKRCSLALPGAKLAATAPDEVLSAVFANKNEFSLDGDSSGKSKKAMCILNYDNQLPSVPTKAIVKESNEGPKLSYLLPLPFRQKVGRIEIGQTFVFKGTTTPNSQDWSINFHSINANYGPHDIPFHLSFRFDINTVRFLTYYGNGGSWSPDDRNKLLPIERNKKFDIRIRALEDRFQIFINQKEWADYPYRIPLSNVSHISCLARNGYNDVNFEYFHAGEKHTPIPFVSGATDGRFSYCKSVFVAATIDAGVTRASINFIRKNTSIGEQNALHFNPRMDLGNVLLNDVQNGQWGREQIEPMIFFQGLKFNMTITNERHGFVVFVDGEYYTTFAHRTCPFDITSLWFVNFIDMSITISNAPNCRVSEVLNTCPEVAKTIAKSTEKPKINYLLPLPFRQKVGKIEIGQTFIFKGTTTSQSQDWSINFHSKNANYGPHNIPLHLSFRFDINTARFLTYYEGGSWSADDRNKPIPMARNKKFDIRIVALQDRFQIFINHKEWHDYPYRIPLEEVSHVSCLARYGYSDVQYEYIHLGEKLDPTPVESGIVDGRFSYCKSLFVSATVEPGVTRTSINFIRQKTKIDGQNALHFNPRFDIGNVLLNDVKSGQWGGEQLEKMPFTRGVPFNLTITNELKGFVINVDGKHYATFAHRICPHDIDSLWFINFVDMNVTVSTIPDCNITESDICPNLL